MLIENRALHAQAGHACHACGSPATPEGASLLGDARTLLDDPTEANVESALRILLALEEPSWVEETPKAHLALLDRALAMPTNSARLRAQALVARGRVAWRAGRIETSESDLEAALELAVGLGDRVVESLALRFLAHVRLLRGRLDDARALASEARAIAVTLGDRQLEALAVSVLGYEARLRGEPRRARELLESAIATFIGVDDCRFDTALRIDVVFTYLDDGELSTAARYAERLLGPEVGLVNRARLEICLGHTALISGDAGGAEQRYGRARDAARRAGDFARELCAIACIAVALFEQGRALDARIELLDMLPAARRFGSNLYSCMFAVVAAVVECTLASYDDARRIIDRARADAAASSIGPGELGLALCDRLVELCESRASAAERNAALEGWAREIALLVPSQADRGAPWLIESRILFRLLSTAIASRLPSVPPRRLLRVHPSGRWFELSGERVHCGARRVMRRLLVALAEARNLTPARQLTALELIERGWLGERMSPESGRNRLHVMLTRMRNLGLRGLLEGDDNGYAFADNLDVELADTTSC